MVFNRYDLIIPVLPLLSTHYGATAFQAGLLMSVFSLMQFVFSPVLGALSDRYGRDKRHTERHAQP